LLAWGASGHASNGRVGTLTLVPADACQPALPTRRQNRRVAWNGFPARLPIVYGSSVQASEQGPAKRLRAVVGV